MPFAAALVLRHADAGPDETIYSATIMSQLQDAGAYVIPYLGFDAGLAAVSAHCGDLLVLQLTEAAGAADAGEIIEAFPDLSIP